MASIRSDVVGGFNAFVSKQKDEPGECLMTLVQFDSQDAYEVICEAQPLEKVAPLSTATFEPRGGTPLYDAMGHAIANAAIRVRKLTAQGQPAEHILFVTFTDGEENASREYSRAKVFAAVTKRQKQGWTFVYLGANQDAFAQGGAAGFAAGATSAYAASAVGTADAFDRLSVSTVSYRARTALADAPQADDHFFDGNQRPGERTSIRKTVKQGS